MADRLYLLSGVSRQAIASSQGVVRNLASIIADYRRMDIDRYTKSMFA